MVIPVSAHRCQLLALFLGLSLLVHKAASSTPGIAYEPLVCFVIRTYYAQGNDYGDKSLAALLDSLRAQTYSRWEALIMVADNRQFPDLRSIVAGTKDDRIWIFAEWVSWQFEARGADGAWGVDYHKRLYNLTDEAIRACPRETDWVVVTNGDNLYDPRFLEALVEPESQSADIVAYDFYSRYQRPTANPCDRFTSAHPSDPHTPVPPCKENEMSFCQMDLGASAWRWDRLTEEDWRFGTIDEGGDGQASDGIMASVLQQKGWKVRRVKGRCLMSHAPNPQMCAASQRIWDDSTMAHPASFGGACITPNAASQLVGSNPAAYEILTINVTFDPHSFKFQGLDALPINCIRARNPQLWSQNAQVYGRVCASRIDRPHLPANLPPHPWDAFLKDEL